MRHIFLAIFFFLGIAGHALGFDAEDRAGVEEAVDAFEAAFEAEDWEAVLPPDRLLDTIAELSGQPMIQLKKQALDAMVEMMSRLDIQSYEILTDQMETGTSEAGANYAIIPSRMAFSMDGGPVQIIDSQVLAAELDEGWRLFRLEGPQHWALFLRTFPEFEGLEPRL